MGNKTIVKKSSFLMFIATFITVCFLTTNIGYAYTELVSRTETLEETATFSTNIDSNFPATKKYEDDDFSGELQRTGVVWTAINKTLTKTGTYTTKKSLNSQDVNAFPLEYNYTDADGYAGKIPRTNINWATVNKTSTKKIVNLIDVNDACFSYPKTGAPFNRLFKCFGQSTFYTISGGFNGYNYLEIAMEGDVIKPGGGGTDDLVGIKSSGTSINAIIPIGGGGTTPTEPGGAQCKFNLLKINTNYTLSVYIRTPEAGVTFAIKNGTTTIQTSNLPTTGSNWVRHSMTFNTGSNNQIDFVINRGDAYSIDITALQLEEGTVVSEFQYYNNRIYRSFCNYLSSFTDCFFSKGTGYVGTNIGTNGSYKVSIVDDVDAYDGKAVEIEVLKDIATFSNAITLTANNTVSANMQYTFTIRYKIISNIAGTGDSSGNLAVWSKWVTSSGSVANDYIFGNTSSSLNTWQTKAITSVSPTNASGKSFYVGTGAVKAGTKFRIDFVTLEKGAISSLSFSDMIYNDGTYSGNLKPQKVEISIGAGSKNPVYRTETQTFSRSSALNNIQKSENLFASSYYIDENGYTGNIPRTGIAWTENWQTGRKSPVLTITGDYGWYKNTNNVPTSRFTSYTDSVSGKTVTGNIPRTSCSVSQNRQTTVYDYSTGIFHWMSNSPNTYESGTKRWIDAPKWPQNYYGSDPRTGWEVYSAVWAGQLEGPYKYFISRTGTQNLYEKKVSVSYRLPTTTTEYMYKATFSGQLPLPDVIESYNGTATYSGTLSKEVIDHYEDVPSTCSADIFYTGNVTSVVVDHYEGTASYSGAVSKVVINGYTGKATYSGTLYQKLNAIVTANNPSYSIDTDILPIGEAIDVKQVATYDCKNIIDKVSIEVANASTESKVFTQNLVLESQSGYYKKWKDTTFKLPTTIPDGLYKIYIRSYSSGSIIKETTYNLEIKTPLNTKGYINSTDIESQTSISFYKGTFTAKAVTSPIVDSVNLVFSCPVKCGGVLYSANSSQTLVYKGLDINGNKIFEQTFETADSMIENTEYGITFVSKAAGGRVENKSGKIKALPNLSINGLSVTKIVKPVTVKSFPIICPVGLAIIEIKTGYDIELKVDVNQANSVDLSFYSNGLPININSSDKYDNNTVRKNATSSSVSFTLYFDDLAPDSTIDVKITARNASGNTVINDSFGKGLFKVKGSLKEDIYINNIH